MKKKTLLLVLISSLLASCNSSNNNQKSYVEEILNGDFEETLNHWTVGGLGAFCEEDVSNLTTFSDGKETEKVGEHCYAGGTYSLPSFTGTLTSDVFTLKGMGYISLRIGAMKNADKCYIEFFKQGEDTPLDFLLNDETEKVNKLTNSDFNNSTITSQLMVQIVDLREYLDENIYIKVTDNDTGSDYLDYSFVNLDDVKVLRNGEEVNNAKVARLDQLEKYHEDVIDNDPPVTELRNGGFETGDLSYWKVMSGTAFNNSPIRSSSELYWGNRKYHAEGNYFLDGFLNDESTVGKLRSEKFTVTDKGEGYSYATFKIGGAANGTSYVAVNDGETGKELLKVKNDYFSDPALAESLVTYYVDLSEYIGKTLYFTVVDTASSGPFGSIIVDDFKINLSQSELINGIGSLKEWANNLDDDTAKATYIDVYNNLMSYPLKGNAPQITENSGYALIKTLSPSSSYNAQNLFSEVSAKDDYTGKNDLKYAYSKLTYNGSEVEVNDYTALDLCNEGEYALTFTVKDAYDSVSTSNILITVSSSIVYNKQITNGDFETGDTTGWTVVSGTFNSSNAVSNATTFWNEAIPFNKGGTYFLNGWNVNAEAEGFTIKSEIFTLGGSGQISFRMGGRTSAVIVKKADGTTIAKYTNKAFKNENFPLIKNGCMLATMQSYVADLSSYLNENLYIELVDEITSLDWGVAFFDEIKTYYSSSIAASSLKDQVVQQGETIELPWLDAINEI